MRLHKQPRLFLVGLPQILPGLDRLGKSSIEISTLRDARAVGALPAEIWKPIGLS